MSPRVRNVAREHYDDVKAQRDAALGQLATLQAKYAVLAEKAMGLKAHEMNAPQASTMPDFDPMATLGPRTQMAIEEFAAGDPQLRAQLIRTAQMQASVSRLGNDDEEQVDREVARVIARGDQ